MLGRIVSGLTLLVAAAGSPAQAFEPIRGAAAGLRLPHIKVELIAERASPGDGEFWVGVLFEPESHWHIYWKNPGDSGTPPVIRWKLPAGASAGDVRWPAPERLAVPPLMDYGFQGRTLLAAPLSGVRPGSEVAARVDWLVCREICVPGRAELKLAVPVASPRPAEFERARARWPVIEAQPLKLTDLGTDLAIELPDRFAQAPEFFPADANQIDNPAPQTLEKPEAGKAVPARLKLRKSDQLSSALTSLKGVLTYGPSGERKSVEIEAKGEGASGGGSGWIVTLQALLFAFLGGIILNLMPCVFPVLSIKVLAFMSQREHGLGLQRKHALVYTAGILLSFWGLTAALLALRAAGEQIGWGFQLQSPGFVACLAFLLFFLGLSLAGAVEIGGSFAGLGQGLVSGEGYASSFFTGVLATVVATPCTAPFMGSAVGFALAQPVPVVLGVFTFLGAGLALPYVAIAWFPALGRALPKPGRWMETFKQLMAFPVFGTVIWLAWVYGLQTDVHGVLRLLAGLLLIALGAWVMGRFRSKPAAAFAASCALVAFWVVLSRAPESRWEPYSAARVTELRAQRRAVFVDFTAAWCVSCKVNELVALQSGKVVEAFARKKVTLLKGDWTSRDPGITDALRAFGRSGVPFYVLYYTEGGLEQVVTLPEILTPQIVLNALEKLPD